VPKSLGDLAAHDCVTFPGLGGTYPWTFGDDETVRVRSRLVVNTAESAIEGALAGVGLTRVLSYQVAADVASGKLVVVLKKFEPAPVPVNLVYLRDRRPTAKVRAFLAHAAAKLRDRLS
jgi:DNA-binding transcriptional LysR family regulator